MRIDASKGGYHDWVVYHAEAMRVMRNVAWVDFDTHQYGTIHVLRNPTEILRKTHQAKMIAYINNLRLIVINPIPMLGKTTDNTTSQR